MSIKKGITGLWQVSGRADRLNHKRRESIYMTNGKRRVKSHKDVEAYLVTLKDGKSTRPKEAKEGLIRSGVLKKNGTPKKVIVSWE